MSEKLKRGDLVKMSDHTRYSNKPTNPQNKYGLVTNSPFGYNYTVRWFNGIKNSSYRYIKGKYGLNDIVHIPNKERCRIYKLPSGGIYINSNFLTSGRVVGHKDIIYESNIDIKNQLVEFFTKLKKESPQYLDCYYKNNFESYLDSDCKFSPEFYDSDIRKYIDNKRNFILLDKVDFI